ncbi:MAG TPA: multicopper oxidase family protein [Edaphobacter sp.]
MMTRRQMVGLSGMAVAGAALAGRAEGAADYSIEIAPCALEIAPRKVIKTTAYNGKAPGPLLRLKEGRPVMIDVSNRTGAEEMLHWHGLFLPSDVDGAMEQGTPPLIAGGSRRFAFTPRPSGLRWYHSHVFAGKDLGRGLYSGQHGFLYVEPKTDAGRYDREEFVALQDWSGHLMASDDGSMNVGYEVSTINGKVLGFGEPIRVKQGERLMLHLLNASATDVHWITMAGHVFEVVALDGNAVPRPAKIPMLRLSPAERVSVVVTMDNPGVWVMGEVRKSVMRAGMGIVVEYAGSAGQPVWQQPNDLLWDYVQFGEEGEVQKDETAVTEIPLVFESKFAGHGAMDKWMINGRSYPKTESPVLKEGQRYRLAMENKSLDDHPVHLHRHSFELKRLDKSSTHGIVKDTVLVKAGTKVDVEFTANDPGLSLFHCHQQDHMDMGFMMLFRYE